MNDIAIRVENLSKYYRIGAVQERYKTFRDSLVDFFRGKKNSAEETLWALKNISLEIKRGEVVGLIGRNGAGKSTMLKILSRITEPTEGFAEIHGRATSLLEVGTGFHAELTGRENVYLNAAILGMKRHETNRKFKEIVSFAEIEKFIDTPVKHYSSGMYMRLAFAVAAHLEAEIVLVDEVLAVGDVSFQKKCLGKMNQVAKEGRTVLFVSHDMTAIAALCRSAILLEGGSVKKIGSTTDVIGDYLQGNIEIQSSAQWNLDNAPGNAAVKILKIKTCGTSSEKMNVQSLSKPVKIVMEFVVLEGPCRLNPVLMIKNSLGLVIFTTANYEEPVWGKREYKPGRYQSECIIPEHLLNDGKYRVTAMLVHETRFVRASAEDAIEFSIHDTGETRGDYLGEWNGIVRPRCAWKTFDIKTEEP